MHEYRHPKSSRGQRRRNHWALESERNQPGPTFPESLFVSLRFEDAGDGIINSFLLPFTPDDITVIALVPVMQSFA